MTEIEELKRRLNEVKSERKKQEEINRIKNDIIMENDLIRKINPSIFDKIKSKFK